MIQTLIIVFLVIPTAILGLVLVALLMKSSSLFAIPADEPVSAKVADYSQPGLSRFQLNRIVSQVRQAERRRGRIRTGRPVYYYY